MSQFLFRSVVAMLVFLMTIAATLGGTPTAALADDGEVTTPVIPDPSSALAPSAPVGLPAPPIPFYGTSLYVLFGQLVQTEGTYYIVEHTSSGEVRSWVTGPTVVLSSLSGKQVGALASREALRDGSLRYQLLGAIPLSDDLAERVNSGAALMYVAPEREITVKLRGRMVHMDQAPLLGNGRTLVGLRAIAEAMGAQVAWDGSTHTATVRRGDREVVVRVGSSQVVVRETGGQDRVIQNDIAPILMNARTMVPARVLSEGLGLKVTWTEATQTVDLN